MGRQSPLLFAAHTGTEMPVNELREDASLRFLQPTCCQRAPTGSFESRVPSLRPSIAHFHNRIPVIHACAQRRHDCFRERADQPQATRQPRGNAVIGGPTSTVALSHRTQKMGAIKDEICADLFSSTADPLGQPTSTPCHPFFHTEQARCFQSGQESRFTASHQ